MCPYILRRFRLDTTLLTPWRGNETKRTFLCWIFLLEFSHEWKWYHTETAAFLSMKTEICDTFLNRLQAPFGPITSSSTRYTCYRSYATLRPAIEPFHLELVNNAWNKFALRCQSTCPQTGARHIKFVQGPFIFTNVAGLRSEKGTWLRPILLTMNS